MPCFSLVRLRRRLASAVRIRQPLLRESMGEFLGTFVLILLGDGVMAQTRLGDFGRAAHGSFVVVSLGWGLAVMLGVFCAARVGRGLINPAVTAAFALIGRLSAVQVVAFSAAQILGAFLGAAAVYSVYAEHLGRVELAGGPFGINSTSGIFCTWPTVSSAAAFYDQVVGTAILACGALAIVDEDNLATPAWAHPLLLGLLVTCIVGAFGLNAGAALNPARDLGPRIFIAAAGWGREAFTWRSGFAWVPVLGPMLGAAIGALVFELFIGVQVRPEPGRGKAPVDEDEEADGEACELTPAKGSNCAE